MIWGTTANAVEKKITFTAREHIYIFEFANLQGLMKERFSNFLL